MICDDDVQNVESHLDEIVEFASIDAVMTDLLLIVSARVTITTEEV
jgi:hypothetical protein